MRKYLAFLPLLVGCSPLAVDFTIGWGSNQTIEKTLKMNQRQTKAQAEANASVIEDIAATVPVLVGMSAAPSPTPTPAVESVTIKMAQQPAPCVVPTVRKKTGVKKCKE